MKAETNNIADYIQSLPEERQEAIIALQKVIRENLPKGFEEMMNYGMIGFVVPHKLYPSGYHCDPKLPLPFINLASQKNFLALYHMGIYADSELYDWFISEYPKHSKQKLDIGKSCIRFKKMEQIPYQLIGELASKISPQHWIELYEQAFRKK